MHIIFCTPLSTGLGYTLNKNIWRILSFYSPPKRIYLFLLILRKSYNKMYCFKDILIIILVLQITNLEIQKNKLNEIFILIFLMNSDIISFRFHAFLNIFFSKSFKNTHSFKTVRLSYFISRLSLFVFKKIHIFFIQIIMLLSLLCHCIA